MILDPKTSKKIFELARDQQEEVGTWEDDEEEEEETERPSFTVPRTQVFDDDEEDDDLERYDQDDYEEEVEEIVSVRLLWLQSTAHNQQEVDEGDLKTLDALLPANAGKRRTLADIIFAKLDDMESGKSTVIRKVEQGPRAFPSVACLAN